MQPPSNTFFSIFTRARPVGAPDFLNSALNKHVALLLASAFLWSLGGVLIKSIDWTPVAIAGSRSLIAMLIIGLVMPGVVRNRCARQRHCVRVANGSYAAPASGIA